MAQKDTQPDAPGAAQAETAQDSFSIAKIYLKDVSFTVDDPKRAMGFVPGQNKMTVSYSVNVLPMGQGVYESSVTMSIEARNNKQERLLSLELTEAGISRLVGAKLQDARYVTEVEAPFVIYPFAREAASRFLASSGFPVPLLPFALNFDAMRESKENSGQAGQETEAAPEQGPSRSQA